VWRAFRAERGWQVGQGRSVGAGVSARGVRREVAVAARWGEQGAGPTCQWDAARERGRAAGLRSVGCVGRREELGRGVDAGGVRAG
jgi:hypothetical protein